MPTFTPYAGMVARREMAAAVVVPMPESGDETPIPLDLSAYHQPAPAFYLYRQRIDGRDYVGVMGSVDVAALADGRVRGHEAVRPQRVAALVDHLTRRPTRIELITATHRARPVFREALQAPAGAPTIDVDTSDGVRHTLWRLPEVPGLAQELDEARHYVTDGHHRVAASLELWRDAGQPSHGTVTVISYPLDGQDLSAFHRLTDGDGDTDEVLARLRADYDVSPCTAGVSCNHGVVVRAQQSWQHAVFRGPTPLLEVAQLEATLAGIALHPRRAEAEEVAAEADRCDGIAFLLAPPPLDTIMAVADAGDVIPAKSTYFSPKPASGIAVN